MRLIVIIALGLGICFRLVNLDHKIYWYDETFTSLRSSGYTEAEVVEHFSQSSIVHVPDLQHYQHPDPQRGLAEMLHSLSSEDPQHPPLYYLLSSYWIRWVGDSVRAMRLLPALLSLLAFPAVYWLCRELFEGGGDREWERVKSERDGPARLTVGWVAIGLLAVSPFHVLYAQEAREYSLWSVTILLATAALLRALRVNSAVSWLIYGLALTASLYTFLFSVWLAIAHAVYVFVLTKFRFSRTIAAYLLATLLALVAFFPWAWIAAQNLNQIQTVTDWTTRDRSAVSLLMSWASMVGRLFYDRSNHSIDRAMQVGFILLVGIAFSHLYQRAAKPIWLLLVALTVVPTLVLIVPDLIWGGGRSTSPRYLIPALCGMQLSVAYLLATKLTIYPCKGERQGIKPYWRWVTATVLIAGIVSGLAIVPASSWWTKPHNQENLAVAQRINQTDHPLVISDAETADLLSLSYRLKPDTALLLRPRCYTCAIDRTDTIPAAILEIPSEYSNIFLFHPRAPTAWKQSLRQIPHYHLQRYPLETASDSASDSADTLWQLVRLEPD